MYLSHAAPQPRYAANRHPAWELPYRADARRKGLIYRLPRRAAVPLTTEAGSRTACLLEL